MIRNLWSLPTWSLNELESTGTLYSAHLFISWILPGLSSGTTVITNLFVSFCTSVLFYLFIYLINFINKINFFIYLFILFCNPRTYPYSCLIFLLLATREPPVTHHRQQAGDSKKVSESSLQHRMNLGLSSFWKATVEIWTATNGSDSFAN